MLLNLIISAIALYLNAELVALYIQERKELRKNNAELTYLVFNTLTTIIFIGFMVTITANALTSISSVLGQSQLAHNISPYLRVVTSACFALVGYIVMRLKKEK